MTATPRPNDPCPCGSGKKYKKCHGRHERPRERYAYYGFEEKPEGLAVDQRGQPILDKDGLPIARFASGKIGGPDQVLTKTQYERASGKEKVVDLIHGVAAPDLPTYLASAFDVVVGVDTSFKPIGQDSVSVTCFIEWPVDPQVGQYNVVAFRNCPAGMEERFGWSLVIGLITRRPGYSENTRVALVVDYDLGNHPRYQSGELPVYGEVRLPKNFKLVYASADTGSDGMNGLLMWCDRHAKATLQQFEQTGRASVGGKDMSLDRVIDLRSKQNPNGGSPPDP